MNNLLLPRTVSPLLDAKMRVMPAVIVSGARQTGNTTLARTFGQVEAASSDAAHAATHGRR